MVHTFGTPEREAPRLPSHPEASAPGAPRHPGLQRGGGSRLRPFQWIWYDGSSRQGARTLLCGGGEGGGVRGASGSQDRGSGSRGSITRGPHPENGWLCRVTSKAFTFAPWLGGSGYGSGSWLRGP